MTRVLVVDNHDSFVHTLVGYLRQLGARVDVVRNDDVAPAAAEELLSGRDAVLLSPGPGAPAAAGVSVPLVSAAIAARIPLLGVCLGHQAIAEALGARVDHAPELRHGMTSRIEHDGSPLFAGMPEGFLATRYHSLAVNEETLPPELEVTARTRGGVVMGLAHVDAPVVGVQFHPESVLTEGGYRLLGNWLESTGMPGVALRSAEMTPLMTSAARRGHELEATQPAQ